MQHTPPEKPESVDLYVQFCSLSNFKSNKTTLENILTSHIKPTYPDKPWKLIPYYKPRKISSMFSTRRRRVADADRCDVVYQFSCSEDACNASYIGYTTQTLSNRIKQHRRSNSGICKHYIEDHSLETAPTYDELRGCFRVLFANNDDFALKIVEAIYI